MKRAVILTQNEYDELLSIIQHITLTIGSMRETKNTRKIKHLLDDARGVLNGYDEEIADLKKRVFHLECVAPY